MNKSHVLKTFNNHFGEFIDDVLRVFPDNTDIITCREALHNIRKMNPKIIINVFSSSVVGPYRSEIENNDITFFIEKNYNKDIYLDNSSTVLQKIDLIRDSVREMTDNDKQNVIKYLNNLLKLCDLYNK